MSIQTNKELAQRAASAAVSCEGMGFDETARILRQLALGFVGVAENDVGASLPSEQAHDVICDEGLRARGFGLPFLADRAA